VRLASRTGSRQCDRGSLRVHAALATDPRQAAQTSYQKLASIEHAGGTLTTLKVYFPNMKKRTLRVWTPPGYRKPTADKPKYPVLYLNDGQNLFEDHMCFSGISWRAGITASRLINDGKVPPFVIAGIDHSEGNRSLDYCPYQPGTGVWDFRPEAKSWPGGGVDEYNRSVVGEVLPFVEEHFGVSNSPKLRGFGGSSFGGICAICMAMQFPDVFGKMLIESPSFWMANGKFLDDIQEYGAKWPKRMFFAMGKKEYSGTRNGNRTDVDTLLSGYFNSFVEIMENKGLQKGRELDSWLEEGAAHNEGDWARRLPGTLTFLLSPWCEEVKYQSMRSTFSPLGTGWESDSATGYHYHADTGWYYDKNDQMYYHEALGKWTL